MTDERDERRRTRRMSITKNWVFSERISFRLDHKMIGRQFLFMGLLMIIVGGLLAMLVRWELAWPETRRTRARLYS